MPSEDQRERDQMWKRIDSHGKQINDLERGLTEVKGQSDENTRNLASLQESMERIDRGTQQLHVDMSDMLGQGRAMRKIVLWLSAIVVFIQIADAIAEDISFPL